MNLSIGVIFVSLIQYAILLSLFIAIRAILRWYQWRKTKASLQVTQSMLEISIRNAERKIQSDIEDNLEEYAKEIKLWFIYRYPTGNTCEVHTLDGWALIDEELEVKPMWFIEEPDEDELDETRFENAQVGQFSQFYEICEDVERLAKWKKLHEEKE